MKAHGLKNVFIDHLSIPGGAHWGTALQSAVSNSDIILLIVTKNWLNSGECFGEFVASFYANKKILPIFFEDTLTDLSSEAEKRYRRISSELQGVRETTAGFGTRDNPALSDGLRKLVSEAKMVRQKRSLRMVAAITGAVVVSLGIFGFLMRDSVESLLERRALSEQMAALSAEEIAAMQPGSQFIECASETFCPRMIILPAGNFIMGDQGDFPEATESPFRKLDVPNSFAVSQFEVSVAQWQICGRVGGVSAGRGCATKSLDDGLEPDLPITDVSWNEAQAYVVWLNQEVHGDVIGPYRLLSEAEWEYASRGHATVGQPQTQYNWGNTLSDACDYANVVNPETEKLYQFIDWPVLACDNNETEVGRIGAHRPNRFGLYDMAGNVSEWVEDCWHDNYEGAPNSVDPWTTDAPIGCDRVVRGGSWLGSLDKLRNAARSAASPDRAGANIGFRVARDLR